MSRYQAYPEYKDSGVEWLEDVPSHWHLTRIKYIAELTPKKPNIDRNLDCSFVPMEKLKTNSVILDEVRLVNDVYDGYTCFRDGDILMAKVTPCFENKNIAIAEGLINKIGFGSSEIYVIRTNELATNRYWYYRLQENSFMDIATAAMTGAGGLRRVPSDVVSNFTAALPSEDEQLNIANFLDHETAKIDTLIEQQQQLIQLLKEKRQAVISHAVTKGLNPNAPMKDSGVEWLGEVPEHWDVLPLKHACNLIKDGTHLPPPRVDIGIPLLSVRNIIDGKFVFRDDDSNISEYDYEVLCKGFIPAINDVVLAIVGATLGKVAMIESMAPFHVQRSVAIFRTKQNKLLPLTLKNIFDSRGFQSLLWEYVGFSAQPGIYLGTLENFQIAVAPADEQLQINAYCSTQAGSIDMLISRGQKAIELMQERRTALISAAVTGKIDVRNWQATTAQ